MLMSRVLGRANDGQRLPAGTECRRPDQVAVELGDEVKRDGFGHTASHCFLIKVTYALKNTRRSALTRCRLWS
jgi:hypothetical protein